MLCCSEKCKKYNDCARAVKNYRGVGIRTVEYLDSFGSGSPDEMHYACGEFGGYAMFVKDERKFCGLGYKELRDVLEFMCDIEPKIDLTNEERDKFDVAIQCVNTVLNCMVDNSPIEWNE